MIPIIIGGNKQYTEALEKLAQAKMQSAEAAERLAKLMAEHIAMQDELAKNAKSKGVGKAPPPLPPLPPIIL